MKKTLLVTTALLLAAPAFAQDLSPTMSPPPADTTGPRPHRAPGIISAQAVQAAVAANEYCAKMPKNYRVTTLVTDSAAVPIALISYDNGAQITQRIAFGKANIVIKYKMKSSDAVKRAATDAAFKSELAANPMIVAARPGGLPIMMGDQLVGSINVSGTPDGHDDECAQAGLDTIKDKLQLIQ